MAAFCGGTVFSRLSPSSKIILDSEGSVALHSCFVEHLESHVKKDPNLASFLGKGGPPEGQIFRSLIDYRLERAIREEKFRELAPRLYAVALERDMVVPPCEVVNTLQGARRDVPVRVDVLDPPYPYRHEDPFPAASKDAEAVDGAFRSVFGPICEFLRRPPF